MTSPPVARYASLLRLCRVRGCTREDAKELVQEAYLRMFQYQRSVKVRDEDSLLRRIVINLSTTYYYRQGLWADSVSGRTRRFERDHLVVDAAPGPERTLAAEQQLDAVVGLLSAVSSRTCQIFIAQRSGYSYEEIAAAFAIKPRTVEKHVASATAMLMQMKR